MKQLSLLLIIFLSACSTLEKNEEVLYLKTENSYLPIFVRGNPNADSYIIWTHGGPGSSGLYYGHMPEINELHKKYRVIYWDQMSAGGSFGNPQTTDYTTDNYANHLQGIVNIITKRYNPKNLFLLGHSWGGFLSSYYLIGGGDAQLAQKRQQQIRGLIGINPVFDIPKALQLGMEFITNYAELQIHQGHHAKYWQEQLDWYKKINYTIRGADVAVHFGIINEAGGFAINQERFNQLVTELAVTFLLDSPFNFYSYFDNQNSTRIYLDIADKTITDPNQANVSAINVPTMILAGDNDKVVFPSETTNAYNMLRAGKDPNNYILHMHLNNAHAVFLDSPKKFQSDIETFISTFAR